MKVEGTFFNATKEGLKSTDFELELTKKSFIEMKKDATKKLKEKWGKDFRGIREFFLDKTETLKTKENILKEGKEKDDKENKEKLKKEILKVTKDVIKKEIENIFENKILNEKIKEIIKKEVEICGKSFFKTLKKVKTEKKIEIKEETKEDNKVKVMSKFDKAKALLNFKK